MSKTTAWAVIIVFLILLGGMYYLYAPAGMFEAPAQSQTPTNTQTENTPIATATYTCDNGHTIDAAYYDSGAAPASSTPGEPPTPTGTVIVSLDGGQPVELQQTVSADGARYSDGDPNSAQGQPGAETFVFWSKGNQALVMENNTMDLTYSNCATPAQQ